MQEKCGNISECLQSITSIMSKIGSDFNEIGVSLLLLYHLNVLSQYFNVLYCGRFTILDLPINFYGYEIFT